MDHYIESFTSQQYRLRVQAIVPISEEEIVTVGQRLLLARQGCISQQEGLEIRNRLVEGTLHLVLEIVERYPLAYRDDLIQEGNLGLIRALDTFAFDGSTCLAYITTAIRRAISNAVDALLPIRIPHSSLQKARACGNVAPLYEMQPVSLQKKLRHSEVCLADVLEANTFSPTPCHHAVRIGQALALLPAQERQIIQLRYGLDEEDSREHSLAEIALKVGMTRNGVMQAERRAVAMLTGTRAVPVSSQTSRKQKQQQQAAQRKQQQQLEAEDRLKAAYALLMGRKAPFTSRQLARTAQVSDEIAQEYLRQMNRTLPAGIGRKTYSKLLHAYQQFGEQQQGVSSLQLSQAAGVKWQAAKCFLDACRERQEVYA